MMEEKQPIININIHGGNNQILPVATKAEQNFYFSGEAPGCPEPEVAGHPWTEEDERRLSVYVGDREKLKGYVATLAVCRTAGQAGEAVARMCADEPAVTPELIVKEKFIRVLLPFLTAVDKGKGIDNLRLNINEAWAAYKRNRQKRGV